eukprot:116199_1
MQSLLGHKSMSRVKRLLPQQSSMGSQRVLNPSDNADGFLRRNAATNLRRRRRSFRRSVSVDSGSSLVDEGGEPSPRDLDDGPLSKDHIAVLFIINAYSHSSQSSQEKEIWIQELPLMVLIFEAITVGAISYDYGPVYRTIDDNSKVWVNISQEAVAAIDVLRELGYVNALKLTSKTVSSMTAFQISVDGRQLLDRYKYTMTETFSQIDTVIFTITKKLVSVNWNSKNQNYELVTKARVVHISKITDCDAVSYVSSPYLPRCFMHADHKEFLDNSSRYAECFSGVIKSENKEFEELIHLDSVRILVCEWIPCGTNQMINLNQKLGSVDRVQGGFFAMNVDKNPLASFTQVECHPGLTSVKIIDYEMTHYLVFQAQICYPEEPGIIQIEDFGVSMNYDGVITYGLKLESVLTQRKDNISFDSLVRVLMDIVSDSSSIVDSLITKYQQSILDITFSGSASQRPKYTAIIADDINPCLKADEFLSNVDYENELKQILGDIYIGTDLDESNFVIVGSNGVLLVGKDSQKYESIICSYISLMGINVFMKAFCEGTAHLQDKLFQLHNEIKFHHRDPDSMTRIQEGNRAIQKEVILFNEIFQNLTNTVKRMILSEVDAEEDPLGYKLFRELNLTSTLHDLRKRMSDMSKTIRSIQTDSYNLQVGTRRIADSRMFHLYESIDTNTKNLADLFLSNERASNALKSVQVILIGTLAFQFTDRVTGVWSVTSLDWAKYWIVEPIMNKPFAWFFVSLMVWLIFGIIVVCWMKWLGAAKQNTITVKIKQIRKVNVKKLLQYIAKQTVVEQSIDVYRNRLIQRVRWVANFGNPKTVDERKRLTQSHRRIARKSIAKKFKQRFRSSLDLFGSQQDLFNASTRSMRRDPILPNAEIAVGDPGIELQCKHSETKIDIRADLSHGYILEVTLVSRKARGKSVPSIDIELTQQRLFMELEEAGCFDEEEKKVTETMRKEAVLERQTSTTQYFSPENQFLRMNVKMFSELESDLSSNSLIE